jgi:uncharacterized paraquat-inducible protein A
MSKTFRIVGIIVIVLAVIVFLLSLRLGLLIALITGFFNVVGGLSYFMLGNVMDRVEALEWDVLNRKTKPKSRKTECAGCGKLYDEDTPACPRCGRKNGG